MNYGYTTTYGGQGGGGGGFTVGETTSSSQTSGGRNQSLRPVTIKQLNDATQAHPEADFRISGADIGHVSFVGQVRNISNLTTFVTYKLDDGTGEVEVKYWLDKDDVPDVDAMDTGGTSGRPRKAEPTVNGYARVLGRLGTFNNRRNITALVVRPITNMNEYYAHFLEATAVHLYFKRGLPPNKQQNTAGAGAGEGVGAGTTAGGAAGGKVLPSMSPLALRMYQTLSNTPQDQGGLHVQQLATEMGLQVNDVLRAGEELINLGQIYTTVDDYTWAILDF